MLWPYTVKSCWHQSVPTYKAKMAPLYLLCLWMATVSGSVVQQRDLDVLNEATMTAFLVPFRETLLHRVAVEWNHTISDSQRLHVQLETCSTKIRTDVQTCKTCTEQVCRQDTHQIENSMEFKDYLLLAAQIVDPSGLLQGSLNEVASKLGDLVDLLGDGSESFIDSMSALGESVGGTFSGAFHQLESVANQIKDTFSDLGSSAIDGLTDLTSTIGDGLSSAGHKVQDLGNTIIDGIGSLFGRRQQTVSLEIRHCMEQCPSCNTLLVSERKMMVTAVCGEDVVRFNETVTSHVIMIKDIFTRVSDKTLPIIAKIEYDTTSADGLKFTRVFVTAEMHGRYVRYRSNVPYDMMNIATSAQNMAEEYWQRWSA